MESEEGARRPKGTEISETFKEIIGKWSLRRDPEDPEGTEISETFKEIIGK